MESGNKNRKLSEHAPGNISRPIRLMLEALHGKSNKWVLNAENKMSRSYTKSELINYLMLSKASSYTPVDVDKAIGNLLGLGILEKETSNISNFTYSKRNDKAYDHYIINFEKLKSFE